MKKGIATFILPLASTGLAPSTYAQGWHLGGGSQSVGFGDDLDLVDRGSGIVSSAGISINGIDFDEFETISGKAFTGALERISSRRQTAQSMSVSGHRNGTGKIPCSTTMSATLI